MPVSVYRSTDLNAPVLAGQVGRLITLLDACLVDGYTPGIVTSLTQTGTTVTVVLQTADMTLKSGQRVVIAGASPAGANGTFVITVVNASTFTYQAPAGLGAITGTITYRRAPVGWAKPFSGTNLAAYKQPAGSNGFYLHVDDTGAGGANGSRVTSYELMHSISLGEKPMPTPAQIAGGGWMVKSSAADATARPWMMVTNGKIFHLVVSTDGSLTAGTLGMITFGDFVSYRPGDIYNTTLACHSSLNTSLATSGGPQYRIWWASGASAGQYATRPFNGVGSADNTLRISNPAFGYTVNNSSGYTYLYGSGMNATSNGTTYAGWTLPYPSPVDGSLVMDKFYILNSAPACIRGELPGMMCPASYHPMPHGAIFEGMGPNAGKIYEAWSFVATSTGQLIFEISDTW